MGQDKEAVIHERMIHVLFQDKQYEEVLSIGKDLFARPEIKLSAGLCATILKAHVHVNDVKSALEVAALRLSVPSTSRSISSSTFLSCRE